MSGIEFLDELRQSGDNTPAIFLTSYQDKEVMKEGFLKGCDDYLKKPVDLEELHLRILSVMKRYRGERKQCIKDVCIDIEQKRLYKDGIELEVTLREFDLIALLFLNKDKVVSKEMITNALWSSDEEGSDGAIRVYINRLKKILDADSLKNIRGLGYMYESV
jgi:DNA-binding response OmpR family regulator